MEHLCAQVHCAQVQGKGHVILSSTRPRHILLKDVAYESIKKLLNNGVLSPGELVSESYLVEMLKMSRTPIRAALQRLEHEGIVRTHPKQGVYIRDISPREVREVFDLRIALETFAVRRVVQTATDEDIASLREIVEKQLEPLNKRDVNLFMSYDALFHFTIMKLCGNQEMIKIFSNIQDKLNLYGREIFRKRLDRFDSSFSEHSHILLSIEQRDEEAACRNMEEHLEFGKRIMLDF